MRNRMFCGEDFAHSQVAAKACVGSGWTTELVIARCDTAVQEDRCSLSTKMLGKRYVYLAVVQVGQTIEETARKRM